MNEQHQLYSFEEAIQWMRDNQEAFASPSNNLVCIGAHIALFTKECFAVKLNYKKQNTRLLINPWHFSAEIFSNHYLLPLNRKNWRFNPAENNGTIPTEFTYMPDFAKWIRYAFIEADQIEGVIGKNLICQIYPELNGIKDSSRFLEDLAEVMAARLYQD